MIIVLLIINIVATYNIKDDKSLLKKIYNSKSSSIIKGLLYVLYFVFVIPVIIDTVILAIYGVNYIKTKIIVK